MMRLRIGDCGLPIADCGLPIADWGLPTGDWEIRIRRRGCRCIQRENKSVYVESYSPLPGAAEKRYGECPRTAVDEMWHFRGG